MKKRYLFFAIIQYLGLSAQSVAILPNTDNYDSNGIVYNNSLFFSKNNKLSKFDGASVTILPDPSYDNQSINGKITGSMVIYDNKLCYNYDYKYLYSTAPLEYRTKDFIVTYNGTTQTAFWNSAASYSEGGISIDDNGKEYEPVLFNNKLVFKGYYYGASNLYTFDGQNIVKINNQNNYNSMYNKLMLGDWALVYDNILYFGYQGENTSFDGFGKFDGTSITKLTGNDREYRGGIFSLNNALYFNILFLSIPTEYTIGNYNATTNVVSKAISLQRPTGFYKPLIINSKAYTSVNDGKLGIFDGTTLNEINKINTNDIGIAGRLKLFGNDIFFQYKNNSNQYFLGKYTQTNTSLSLIPNPSTSDIGIGSSLVEFNAELYFIYKTSASSPAYLAKYNGTNITVLPNPDTGAGVQDSKFVVYGNDLYFPYKNSAGIIVMAKYGTTVLGTQEVAKNTNVSIYKDNKGFTVISKSKDIDKLEILDSSGRIVSNAKPQSKKYYFEIESAGIYVVKAVLKDGETTVLKIRN